jgi:predicted dehydrogenase
LIQELILALLRKDPPMPERNEPVRLGIVGLGASSQSLADVYAAMPEVRVAGIVSRDPDKRAKFAAMWDTRGHETIESLLEDPDSECVVIATPPYLHSAQGLQAIQAGKHVYFETPIATELVAANALLSAAKERGVRLSVDYVMPYTDLHGLLLRIVSSGAFGRVVSIMLEHYANVEDLDADDWFWDKGQSGGIFVEHGVQFFDLGARLALSKAEAITGFASREADGRENRVLASAQYGNGAHASYYHAVDRPTPLAKTALHTIFERGAVHSSGWIPTRMEIEGQASPEDLQLLSRLIGEPLTVNEALPPPGVQGSATGMIVSATVERPSEDEEYRKAIQRCMADFALAVRDPDRVPSITPDDAYESLRVAVAARASAQEN